MLLIYYYINVLNILLLCQFYLQNMCNCTKLYNIFYNVNILSFDDLTKTLSSLPTVLVKKNK